MISIKNIKKYYDKTLALSIDELTISDNHILGLIGTNGSGKSTLLRLIAGVLTQEEGYIEIDNVSVKDDPTCKKDLLYISDDPIDHVNTSIDTLLYFYSLFYGMKKEVFYSYLDEFEIPRKGNLSKFSKGMRRRTYLAIALAVQPKILLLDEAFDGLDPVGRKKFIQQINSLLEEKDITMIVASHSLRELEDLCDSYLMLSNGKIVTYAPEGLNGETCIKISLAFKEPFDFEKLNTEKCVVINHIDRIGTLYFEGTREQAEEFLNAYVPAVVEYNDLTAEEYFILKTEGAKNV